MSNSVLSCSVLLLLCCISVASLPVTTMKPVVKADCPLAVRNDIHTYVHATSCYYFVTNVARDYTTASSTCTHTGGRLAKIGDNATQKFIQDSLLYRFSVRGQVWFGLTNTGPGGIYVMPNGAALNYTNWAPNEPAKMEAGNGCVAVDLQQNGQWKAFPCHRGPLFIDETHNFICEFALVDDATTTTKTTTTTTTTTTPAPTTTSTTTTTTTPKPTTTTTTTTTPKPTTTTTTPTTTTTTTTTPKPTTTTTTPTTTTTTPTTTTTTTTTTTPKPTTTPEPTTTAHGHGQHTTHPHAPLTTTLTAGECPRFECNLDCGFSGFQVDSRGCITCACDV